MAENDTAGVRGIVFRLGNQWLDVAAKRFCLLDGCLDALVLDQRSGHIAQHRFPVFCGPAELFCLVAVSHGLI